MFFFIGLLAFTLLIFWESNLAGDGRLFLFSEMACILDLHMVISPL